jgi:glutamate/tyrosine decarboxylase-like PLP-dependent enzyme
VKPDTGSGESSTDTGREPHLQLSREEMLALGQRVVETIVDWTFSAPERPALICGEPAAMARLLDEPPPEHGQAPEAVLDRALHDVLPYTGDHIHPRFFGFVPSAGNFVSTMADALTSGFNVFAGGWLAASGPTQVELVTVEWLRRLCGLPEGAGGFFATGGSEANLIALAAAREVQCGQDWRDAVLYASDQTHSAVTRGLRVLGFRPDQLCTIESDPGFRLPVEVLRTAIARDRAAGRRPFCVVANVGTTNTGAVDPLPAVAELCREEGLWLHADGAYGAAAVLTEEGRSLIHGLELVDSLALDPHKWLFQPYEIGCVLMRDPSILPRVFAMHPEYLRDIDRAGEVNFRDYGIQLTRGFRALKLWMSIQVFGVEAFRAAIRRGMHLARVAEMELRASPRWEIVTGAQLGVTTFRFIAPGLSEAGIDDLNSRIVDAGLQEAYAFVVSTELRGRVCLRLCTLNPRSSEEDVRETIRRLETYGVELLREAGTETKHG